MPSYKKYCEAWEKYPPSIAVDFDDDWVTVEITTKEKKYSIRWVDKYDPEMGISLWEDWSDDEFFSTLDEEDQSDEVARCEAEGWLAIQEMETLGKTKQLPEKLRTQVINDLTDYVFSPLIISEWERRHPPQFSSTISFCMREPIQGDKNEL